MVRKRVSVVVVHKDKVLGFNAEDPNSGKKYFFLPGGEIEAGESIEETGIRETLEETGYSVEVLAEPRTFRKYDFNWNGKIHDCETWYLVGRLTNVEPIEVNDASYHKGVQWVHLENVGTIFNYHKDISEPIEELLSVDNIKP